MSGCRWRFAFPRPDFASSASTSTQPRPPRSSSGEATCCISRTVRWRRPGGGGSRRPPTFRAWPVPTPLTPSREPDLSFVINTFESLLPHLHTGQLVSLESTTYPGTTEEELKPRIESRGFEVGKDIFLCFSPEREDPGNAQFTTRTIPKICAGTTPMCLEVGVALYSYAVEQVVSVSSTRAAEMTKLLEKIHRAVNIGLVNELKIIADRMDIDIYEVIRAASTKPFGFVPYYPGPGLGGHCIPIDPF